jgi:hypothetical protein
MTAARIKVLVIDDEPPIRKLLRMGLTTQSAQTGTRSGHSRPWLAGHSGA